MPNFKYNAKDQEGKSVTGTIEAVNFASVVAALRSRELIIVSLEEEKTKKGFARSSGKRVKIKLEDLVVFSRQLSTMVTAGIPLVQGLDILRDQIEHKDFKGVVRDLGEKIEGGDSLSEALAKHPGVFSHLFVNMVRAGESSGSLDEILDRLATYLEKTASLRRKVKSALVYPTVVTIMAMLISLVLVLKVIPGFESIFSTLKADLPMPTRVLIAFSNLVRHYFIFMVVLGVIIFLGLKAYIKTARGRLVFDRFKLNMLVFGPLFKKVAVSKFTRTLSTLVRSGVPILNALEIVGKTAGNKVVEDAVDDVKDSVREGESIAEPLSRHKVFPPMVVRMTSVGEETGRLEDMLSKIADFYDEQVDAAVAGLTSMIEPLIIAFLGIVIGSIVVAMFLPILKLTEIVGK